MPPASARAVAVLAALALLAGAPGRGQAAGAAGPPAPRRTAFTITVAGGVSLGAYEAGVLHYTLAWLEANERRYDLRLATGASAGSMNALLAVLARCGEQPAAAPTEGLFWRTWIPAGLHQLYVPEEATQRSALSRRWLTGVADDLEARWREGLAGACDVVLGVSTTRVTPRQLDLAAGALRVPRVEEHFALRVQGRGPGRPPRLTNYVDAEGAGEALLLPEDAAGEVPFAALRDLLFASAAVPVAFAPVELAYCAPARGTPHPRCPAAEATRAPFIDGGVFDNTPLRLAASLARAGLREQPDGDVAWLPEARGREGRATPRALFGFVSPDVTAYPVAAERFRLDDRTSLFQLLQEETQAFLATARAKNLNTLLEETPELADQVVVTARHLPAAGSPLAAFFGFFEEDFRRFDFYLGMYDARRALAARSAGAARLVFPEQAPGADAGAWQPLRCLTAAVEAPAQAGPACAGDGLRQLRILAQVSLERLYGECAAVPPDAPPSAGACGRARAGEAPPLLEGVPPLRPGGWRRGPQESEPAWAVRLLAGHGFHFRDLGLRPDQGEEALRRIRLELEEVVWSVTSRQPVGDDLMLRRVGQVLANQLVYLPPRDVLWLTYSRDGELGWSHAFTRWPGAAGALQLHVAVQMYGLYDLLSSQQRPWGLAPLVGVGTVLPSLSGPTLQYGLFARAGVLFGSGDDFGTGACADPASTEPGACTRFTAQLGAYAGVLDLVRVQFQFQWFPALGEGQRASWYLAPALGVQLAF